MLKELAETRTRLKKNVDRHRGVVVLDSNTFKSGNFILTLLYFPFPRYRGGNVFKIGLTDIGGYSIRFKHG
jgi:hypothetical protein